jgi:hypothetical protein
MRNLFLPFVAATVALSGSSCSDAGGNLIGGESLFDANVSALTAPDGATPPRAISPPAEVLAIATP